jgi:hypothetical protein
MYDTISRQAIVGRMQEERLAEARRTHLLRAARGEDGVEVRTSAVRTGGLATRLSGAIGSLRHGIAQVAGDPHGAPAR